LSASTLKKPLILADERLHSVDRLSIHPVRHCGSRGSNSS
jgi:hypothetical protein